MLACLKHDVLFYENIQFSRGLYEKLQLFDFYQPYTRLVIKGETFFISFIIIVKSFHKNTPLLYSPFLCLRSVKVLFKET